MKCPPLVAVLVYPVGPQLPVFFPQVPENFCFMFSRWRLAIRPLWRWSGALTGARILGIVLHITLPGVD